MDEFDLIDRLIAPLAAADPGTYGLANDAAVLSCPEGREIVLTKDMMAEGVHFLADDPPGLVARKLLRTNLSDLAAMGAEARAYLLGLAIDGRRDETWLAGFFEGLRADQNEFGIALLGGDTIVSYQGVLTLSLTAVGTVAAGAALTRSGARPSDLVAVSGTIGDAALGLMARQGRLAFLPAGERALLVGRYRLPQPRLALGSGLVGLASAVLDVSDGLLQDAGHIARRSGLHVAIDWSQVPLSEAGRRALEVDAGLQEVIVAGGDDYELLFAFAPERLSAVEALARRCGTAITVVGRCLDGSGVALIDARGRDITPARRGWRHGAAT